jgi:hypothetical protein
MYSEKSSWAYIYLAFQVLDAKGEQRDRLLFPTLRSGMLTERVFFSLSAGIRGSYQS